MTPAARLAALAELLAEIEAATAPAEQLVAAYFRARRFAGSKDRRWITERLYRALRRLGELGGAATELGLVPGPRAQAILSLLLFDDLPAGELAERWFDGPHALAAPDAAEAAAFARAASLDLATLPAAARWNFPPWLAARIETQYGARAGAVMMAYREAAPVTFRVNRQKAARDDIIRLLKDEGIEAAPTALSPDGVTLTARINLTRHPLLEGGRIEPQDEAAQIAARLAMAAPGMTVVDFCAGGGGKALAMAANMGHAGVIHAFDIDARRMRDIARRSTRAGVSIIQPLALAGDAGDEAILAPLAGRADRVFVDAPCSGSGTWRRQPDQKWKFSEARFAELVRTQEEIIARAAPLVAKGGRLIYATCSILAAENEAQVTAFLRAHPDFRLLPVAGIWEAAGLQQSWDGDCLALTPDLFASDGFFAAVLERAP